MTGAARHLRTLEAATPLEQRHLIAVHVHGVAERHGLVLEVIRELAAGGMTMLIATHEMGFARDIADRICFLDEGVILEQGLPEQILTEPKEPRTQQFLQRIIEAGRL